MEKSFKDGFQDFLDGNGLDGLPRKTLSLIRKAYRQGRYDEADLIGSRLESLDKDMECLECCHVHGSHYLCALCEHKKFKERING